jgi:hypothetical protein
LRSFYEIYLKRVWLKEGNVLVLLQVNQDKIPFAGNKNYGEAGVQDPCSYSGLATLGTQANFNPPFCLTV